MKIVPWITLLPISIIVLTLSILLHADWWFTRQAYDVTWFDDILAFVFIDAVTTLGCFVLYLFSNELLNNDS